MYCQINNAYKEDFGSAFSIYGALKGQQRVYYPENKCYCKQTIHGKKVDGCLPVQKCGDCKLNPVCY